MLSASGYPGMKIMQFAFDSREPGNYLPYTYPHNSVVYTGTHDNVTTEGWRAVCQPRGCPLCLPLPALPARGSDRGHDLRLPCQCFGYWLSSPWPTGASGPRRPASTTPSTRGSQLAVAVDTPLTSLLAEHIADLTALYDRIPAAADR